MPPNADTDVEETTSCDIYEIISELKDLNLEISMIEYHRWKTPIIFKEKIKQNWIFCLILILDISVHHFLLISKKKIRYSMLKVKYALFWHVNKELEPSSTTCEQRGYGRFKCGCGHSWGSSFSYTGYTQTCFTCGDDVEPEEITQISYDKRKTKRRFKESVQSWQLEFELRWIIHVVNMMATILHARKAPMATILSLVPVLWSL